MLTFRSPMVSSLRPKTFIHFYFSLWCDKMFQFHCFTGICSVFTATFFEETAFSSLYMLASFVVNQLTTGVCIYLWAPYSTKLINVSVFVLIPYCFEYCSFVVQSKSWAVETSSSFIIFLKIGLIIWGVSQFHKHFRIISSSFVENVMGIRIGNELNLQIALSSLAILTIFIIFQSNNRGYLSISLCHFQFPSASFIIFRV